MTIMGFDASLNSSGYSIHHTTDNRWQLIASGTVKVKSLRDAPRLLYVKRAFEVLVDQYRPSLIVYEDYSMGSKGKTFHIGELGGVLKLTAFEIGIPLLLVPPSNLKQFTTGKGNADKEMMARHVEGNWGAKIDSDDEADAYALAKFGQAWSDRRVARTYQKHQREALLGAIFHKAITLQTIAKRSARA